ncbi:hypothetical protein HYW59_00605 [Candidatus Kaiserbacteria bacterium]|nr:hypothetical protein [Candidatus Kaiserbacteria bacterium]
MAYHDDEREEDGDLYGQLISADTDKEDEEEDAPSDAVPEEEEGYE